MSKRSCASATISFGLVSIPVKFYVSASAETVNFNMITPAGNRVKQYLKDAITGAEVTYGECSKGYEIEKDKFVIFTKDEIKSLAGGDEDNGCMEIREFVPASDLSPLAVEKTYYLDSGKGGDKAYRLFVAALVKQGKCAVAQWTNRGRQHLVVIGVHKGTLVAHQMYYAEEMREFELDCATYAPKDVEINLACQLMDSLTTTSFDAAKYANTYNSKVKEAAEAKASGGTVAATGAAPSAPVTDLFEALKASLGKQGVKVESTQVETPTAAPKKGSKKSKAA